MYSKGSSKRWKEQHSLQGRELGAATASQISQGCSIRAGIIHAEEQPVLSYLRPSSLMVCTVPCGDIYVLGVHKSQVNLALVVPELMCPQ